jgi:hypothetical protein
MKCRGKWGGENENEREKEGQYRIHSPWDATAQQRCSEDANQEKGARTTHEAHRTCHVTHVPQTTKTSPKTISRAPGASLLPTRASSAIMLKRKANADLQWLDGIYSVNR